MGSLQARKQIWNQELFHKRYMAYLQRGAYCPWAMTVFAVASEEKVSEIFSAHAIDHLSRRQKRISTGEFNRYKNMSRTRTERKSKNPQPRRCYTVLRWLSILQNLSSTSISQNLSALVGGAISKPYPWNIWFLWNTDRSWLPRQRSG